MTEYRRNDEYGTRRRTAASARPEVDAARRDRGQRPVSAPRSTANTTQQRRGQYPPSAAPGAFVPVQTGSGRRPAHASAKKGKGGPWRVVFWIALAVFVVAVVALGALAFSYWQAQNNYNDLADQVFEAPDDTQAPSLAELQVDWDALRAINPEVVGWIYIPGTVVNYPICHTDNDEYYLRYDFYGEPGWGATYGTIFLQAANQGDFSDANNIVYGHNLRSGDMFSCFHTLADPEKFNATRTIYLLTPEGNYKLRTFSLVHCRYDDPLAVTSFESDQAMADYIQDKMNRTVAEPEGELPAAADIDHSFAFVTCDSLPTDGRYVLFAYVEETTVAGHNAVGGTPGTGDVQGDQEAADAVSDASKELAAA